jgi:hypothetical protein
MIETVMLIALGFTVASLLALLIAPALWRRAVKLTTRKIKATMPISVADINADKDLLRAEYAVEMRRLELGLGKAKERAARHLMERNQHTVEIGKLETEIAMLKNALTERTKASSVLEQTVQKHIPEVEAQQEHSLKVIAARDLELSERANAFANQGDALELAQKMVQRQEQEIDRLRQALESLTGTRVNFWGKELSEDIERTAMAKENGKLNAELSRLREDIAQLRELDIADAAQLRTEMHRLADLMLSGKAPAKSKKTDPDPAIVETEAIEETSQTKVPQEEEPESKKPAQSKRSKRKQAAKPRKSLSERLAGLKHKKQKENA